MLQIYTICAASIREALYSVPMQCLPGSRSYGLLYETLRKSDFTLNCSMPYIAPLILRALLFIKCVTALDGS